MANRCQQLENNKFKKRDLLSGLEHWIYEAHESPYIYKLKKTQKQTKFITLNSLGL